MIRDPRVPTAYYDAGVTRKDLRVIERCDPNNVFTVVQMIEIKAGDIFRYQDEDGQHKYYRASEDAEWHPDHIGVGSVVAGRWWRTDDDR